MVRDANDTLIFLRVVQEGSFTAAARTLQIPKTTVSRRVLELENHIGAQLLRRTTRKLSLTEAGSVYFDQCRSLVATLENAEAEVHRLRDGPRGWLRVTLPYSFGVQWIAPLLPGFSARYPEVKVEIMASHVTLDLVEAEVDLALRLGEMPDSSLVARRLASFPTGIYASPAYIKRMRAPETPEMLKDHDTLALHQSRRDVGYAWPLRQEATRPRHFPINPVTVASDPLFLYPALLQGRGLSLAMDLSMRDDVRARRLVRVLPHWLGPPQDLNAVSARERMPSPKVQAFIRHLREQLQFPPSS